MKLRKFYYYCRTCGRPFWELTFDMDKAGKIPEKLYCLNCGSEMKQASKPSERSVEIGSSCTVTRLQRVMFDNSA